MRDRSQMPATDGGTGEMTDAAHGLRLVGLIALGAVLLGFTMQGIVLFGKLAVGAASGTPAPVSGLRVAVDLAQGVSWSLLVCTGVGIATLVLKTRVALAGLISLVCAPLAIALAKSAQKIMASVVGAANQPAVLTIGTISLIKAIEYGVLGWLLARLVKAGIERPAPFVMSGAAVGAVFGGTITALGLQVSESKGHPQTPVDIAATALNEMLFPIGCAIVIFVGQIVARHVRVIAPPVA